MKMAAMIPFTPPPRPSHYSLIATATAGGGGGTGKQTHHLLFSLSTAASPSATDRLLRKFVSSSSKSAALHALSSLLSSSSSPAALPMYRTISATPWFKWSPKLAAALVALLEHHGRSGDAHTLTLESAAMLKSPKDLALFYCDLIDALAARDLRNQALESIARLRGIPFSGRRPFESMIRALSLVGMPGDAEAMLVEMVDAGLRPSAFEFRSVVQGYGQLGLFDHMRRVLDSMVIDTVCANIVLSCYGDHGELPEMVSWVRKMRELGIKFSVRTFNTVFNSCATVVLMMRDSRSLPLSVEAFVKKLEVDSPSLDEALLVRELVCSLVLEEMLEWSTSEGKLDLHGFHPAAAYLTLLQWMQELRLRFGAGEVAPLEISIVCGSGKHSRNRGDSPIKQLVSEMMFRSGSPMRIDRKNAGRFVAKGKVVSNWLC